MEIGNKMKIEMEIFGYKMGIYQAIDLIELLEKDIMNRYCSEEYYDPKIIEDYISDNNLKKVENE